LSVRTSDRRTATVEARIELRKQVLALRREGKTLIEISRITGYARSYCSTLARQLEETPRSATALNRGGRARGTGRKLTAQQEQQVQRWICGKCPDQLQLPFALWTLRAVQELIRKKFRIRLPTSTTALYLSRWWFTSQRPKKRAYERDDAAVKRWLEVEYPGIARRAKIEKAEISWGDETGLRSDQTRHRGYAPKGQTPVVLVPARRRSLSILSAITNQGKVRFMIFKGALRPPTLVAFMARLIRDARQKIFLILDNLNVHKATKVRKWLSTRSAAIEVFFLPPYSPDLNPDEYLNGDLKRSVYSDIPARDQAALHRQALSHLRRIQKLPARVAAYFKHPSIRYAA
jgi:transposase